jgi:exonuclease SbcC
VLLFLIFLLRHVTLKQKVSGFDETAAALAAALNSLDDLPQAETPVDEENKEPTSEEGGQPGQDSEASDRNEMPDVVDRAARVRLSQRIVDWSTSLVEVRDGVASELDLLKSRVESARLQAGELNQAIAIEQQRLDRSSRLKEMMTSLKEKFVERQQHIEICSLADELIQGTAREVSHQFNRKLRGLVSKTLPLFTENRYEHLQIDDDLTVRAFSSEKRDFMDLDEISSGTQRQIMLAVRLALSQELVGRAVQGGQFLFLDEPFAFFDDKRTRNSLAVLPTLSEHLKQIWIVAQDFSGDLKFDLHIQCDRGYQSLPAVQD